jgi:hypothetical protein
MENKLNDIETVLAIITFLLVMNLLFYVVLYDVVMEFLHTNKYNKFDKLDKFDKHREKFNELEKKLDELRIELLI